MSLYVMRVHCIYEPLYSDEVLNMSLHVMPSAKYEPICNDVLNMSLCVMTC